MIGVASGANLALTPEDVDRLPDSLFREGDVLLAGLEIPVGTAQRALERGVRAKMRTVLNPAPVPTLTESEAKSLLAFATVITPNRAEALALAGMTADAGGEPDWRLCADRLLATGAAGVVITLGSSGCLAAAAGGPRPIPAPRVEAIDTVGAGDAFTGALAVALAERRSLLEAAAWASAAAALAVTRPGAQSALPYRDAIDELAARSMVN